MTKPSNPIPSAENNIILPKRPALERLHKSHIIKHMNSIRPVIHTYSEIVSNSVIDIKAASKLVVRTDNAYLVRPVKR